MGKAGEKGRWAVSDTAAVFMLRLVDQFVAILKLGEIETSRAAHTEFQGVSGTVTGSLPGETAHPLQRVWSSNTLGSRDSQSGLELGITDCSADRKALDRSPKTFCDCESELFLIAFLRRQAVLIAFEMQRFSGTVLA